MAFHSRRLAAVALGAALAVVSGLAGPVGVAAAADPVTSSPAPTLSAPADDPAGAQPLKDVVLQWAPVAHADSYEVQVSPNGDWTNNTVTLPNGGMTVNTVFEMPISLPHSFYYWRVRGFHGTAHTAWSSARQFLREWYLPFSMLKLPTSSDPTLSWQPVQGASLYRVRFGTRPDFSTTGKDAKVFTCYTQETTFTPYATNIAGAERMDAGGCFDTLALTSGATYYWEVIAFDDSTDAAVVADTANDAGWECAQIQPECDTYLPHFNTATPSFVFKPGQAGAVAPGAVATGLKTTWHAATATATDCTVGTCPMTPTFSWNPVAGANAYRVHVWRDPAHLNTYRVYDTATPSITPREGLFDAQAGSGYYWSVQAGTCKASATQLDCSQAPASTDTPSPGCPDTAAAATPPTVDAGATGLTASPAGPNGAQSVAAGQTATITLTGTGFGPGACVAASSSGGVISNIAVVDASHVTFKYAAPASTMSVTFTVVNTDGGTSNASPSLDVFADDSDELMLGPLSPATTFKKASGAVALTAPADGAETSDASVTFSWDDFLAGAGRGAYDVRNYHLQVASDADFDNVAWDNPNIDLTRYTNPTSLLPDGKWFWRIQGIDESGNPLTWSATSSFTKDSTPPAFQLATKSDLAVDGPVVISASEPVEGMTSGAVRLVPVTGGRTVSGKVTRTGQRSWSFTPSTVLATGQVYRLSVAGTVHDAAGNQATVTGGSVRTATKADDSSAAMQFRGSWSKHVSSQALGGTFRSSTAGHSVKLTVAGKNVKVFACRGPEFGQLSVTVDGAHKATVNEHRAYTSCGKLLWKGSLSGGGAHTVRLVAANGAGNVDQVRVG